MPAFNVFMLLVSFLKLTFYMRMFESYGNLVETVRVSLNDVVDFVIFMIFFFIFFTLSFGILGAQFERNEFESDWPAPFKDIEKQRLFPGVTRMMTNFINVYRNSLGDIAHPVYHYWTEEWYKVNSTHSAAMIYLIWLLMVVNQLVMQVVLFNFLIAIVSESYYKVQALRHINLFEHKSELNHEFYLTKKYFNKYVTCTKAQSFDVLFMMAPEYEEIGHSKTDWTNFYEKFRQYYCVQADKEKEQFISFFSHKIDGL